MKATNPLSAGVLIAVLLACAIAFYLLVPTNKKLLDRLVQDGKSQRAMEVLHSLSDTEKATDLEFYELMRLRLNRQLGDPKDQAGVIAQIEASLEALERFASNQAYLAEVLESLSVLDDSARALRLVEPHLETYPQPVRQVLVVALVRDALASDRADVAAAAYEHSLRPFPPGETNLVEAVRLWRAAARPEQALRVLEDFEQRSGKNSSALGTALEELKFNLLREVSRNSEAFELASSLSRREAQTGEVGQKWLERMQATADNPSQRRKLLEEYRQEVHRNPADTKTWRLIVNMAMAADELDLVKEALQKLIQLTPQDTEAQTQLAQIYEWSDAPDRAFDLYLKLAGQNDEPALERLIALNPGLYRDTDVLRLLRELSRKPLPDKYRLFLARLLTRHGEYAEAYALYNGHLRDYPKDTAVMEEYAETLQRQQSYESALAVWKDVQKLKPKDDAVEGHVAELHYQLGDFENALQAYRQLAKRSTDLAAILKYCTLTESLGELQSLSEALALKMELKKQDDPEDFIKLAYVFNLLGADAKRRSVLERGLARFPTNDSLRLQLSVLLVEQKEDDRALPILARSNGLKTKLDPLRLYLELLIRTGRFSVAERFLKTGIQEELLETQSIILLTALIYEGNGNDAAAEQLHRKLYQQHPGANTYALSYLNILIRVGKTGEARTVLQPLLIAPTPDILREAARVYAELGDYKQAERLQSRVMELPGQTRFQDLIYLGDIRQAGGSRSAAQRAYRQALASAQLNLQLLSP
jgi:tetratricopeptide (TPR) repeat protein